MMFKNKILKGGTMRGAGSPRHYFESTSLFYGVVQFLADVFAMAG